MRRPAAPRITPAGLAGDLLILFLLLFGCLFCLVSAASLEVVAGPLVMGCAVCALCSLVVWSLPRWWPLLPIAAAAAGWGWGVYHLWEQLCLGEISLRCAVVNTVCTSLELDGFIRPIAQLPDQVWAQCLTLLLLAALPPLALLLGLMWVRLHSFWLLFCCTFPLLLAPLCISVTPAWLPLMALLTGWLAPALGSLADRWDRLGGARLTLLALPASALLLALLTLAMPQDSYRRPQWADDALDTITNWAVRTSDALFQGNGPFGGGSGGLLADADGKVPLSQAGPLSFSGRTVLEVNTDLRGRIYLRGFSRAVYDGESWAPLPEKDYAQLNRSGPAGPAVNALDGYQPMNFPALADRNTFTEKQYASFTVRNLGADPGYVYFPYHILSQPEELNGASFVHDSYLARAEDVWSHTLYIQPDCSPVSGASLPAQAGAAEGQYARFAYSYYTQVPLELQDTLMNSWMELADAKPEDPWFDEMSSLVYGGDALDKVFPVRMAHLAAAYLDAVAEYDPNTPQTPEGEDFVGYFLTESHQGYCMHFASTVTLMLRSIGIPARYVAGYVADVPASGRAMVPDSAAHAWVEVYLAGYGWEPVEVTPAYAGAQPGRSSTEEAAPEATPTPTPTPTPVQASAAPTPTPTADPDGGEVAGSGLPLGPLLAALALLLAVLAVPLRRGLLLRRRAARFAQASTNAAVISAYRYVERLAPWGVAMPQAVAELAKKAKFSPHTLTEAERRQAVELAQAAGAALDAGLPWHRRWLLRYLWCLS